MPIPSVYVARFFQLVTARQFAEAERVLQRLRQRIQTTEWNKGYFQALYGMLLAQKNNDDRYAFLSNTNLSDRKELQTHRREFLKQARNRVHADYDRGYFTAWASYMQVLARLQFSADETTGKSQQGKEVKTQAEAGREVAEEVKEKTRERSREEEKKEIKADTEKSELKKAETAERTEPRQSTLFDFSK